MLPSLLVIAASAALHRVIFEGNAVAGRLRDQYERVVRTPSAQEWVKDMKARMCRR